VLAPRGSTRFAVGGLELAAPAGFTFDQALAGVFDGDGAPSGVAWMLPNAPGQAGAPNIPELWYFPAAGDPRRLLTLPGFVPTSPNCRLTATLVQSGPRSVTLDANAACEGNMIQRTPTRALVVLVPAAEKPEILTLRVAAAAPGESITIDSDTSDRDADGRDDVRFTISLAAGGAKPVSAELAWLDRAAGISRDTSEPQKSLARAAGREVPRAKNKKTATDALVRVAAVRRLLGTLCAEGATPRVFDADGNAIGCGGLGPVVDALASAEVAGELTREHPLGAFGALARDGWYFGKTSAATRKKLEASVLEGVDLVTTRVVFLEPRPRLPAPPRYSPLAFDAGGRLSIETTQGKFELDAEGGTPTRVEGDATPPRALEVTGPSGERFLGVTYSCDRSETTLLVTAPAAPLPPIVTDLLSPRPGACGRGRFEALPAFSPIAYGAGLRALVGGVVVGGPLEPGSGAPGSPRSLNGRFLAVPTIRGVLFTGVSARLFDLGAHVSEPLRLSDCVPSDDGQRVACVLGDRALLAIAGGG
jgi:hypothetical protein